MGVLKNDDEPRIIDPLSDLVVNFVKIMAMLCQSIAKRGLPVMPMLVPIKT